MKQLVTITLVCALTASTALAQGVHSARHVERIDTPLSLAHTAIPYAHRAGTGFGDLQLATIDLLRHATLVGGPIAPIEGGPEMHPLPRITDRGGIVATAPPFSVQPVAGPLSPVGSRPIQRYVQVSISEIGIERSLAYYGCGTNPAGSLVLLEGTLAVGETIVLGVGNPLGTQPAGSFAFLAFSSSPDAAFPCGTSLPRTGMGGAGGVGELLIDVSTPNPFLVLGPEVLTEPTALAKMKVKIPDVPTLAGMDVFCQGAVYDPFELEGVTLGLGEAARVTIGS